MHPVNALIDRVRRDPARPLLTHIDSAAGTRIELSATTMANNVAKTAGLLADELGVPPSGRVGLALPAHWNVAVWAMATWSIGADLVWLDRATGIGAAEVDVVATSPTHLADLTDAPECVAVSSDPLGGPCRVTLPTGVLDWSVAMRGHPDVLVPYALDRAPEQALSQARDPEVLSGQRLTLVTDDPARLVTGLLTALAGQASLIVVTGGQPTDLPALLAQERSDRVLNG